MPIGNEIATFSFKSTSITYEPGEGDSTHVKLNLDGVFERGGESDVVLGTLDIAAVGDGSGGNYVWTGQRFSSDGADIRQGSGYVEADGPSSWKCRGYVDLGDGTKAAVEGVIELETRTLTGKVFEWD